MYTIEVIGTKSEDTVCVCVCVRAAALNGIEPEKIYLFFAYRSNRLS